MSGKRGITNRTRLAEFVRETREKRFDWEPKELADAAGLAINTISQIENGTRGIGKKSLRGLARAFGMSEAEFLRMSEAIDEAADSQPTPQPAWVEARAVVHIPCEACQKEMLIDGEKLKEMGVLICPSCKTPNRLRLRVKDVEAFQEMLHQQARLLTRVLRQEPEEAEPQSLR